MPKTAFHHAKITAVLKSIGLKVCEKIHHSLRTQSVAERSAIAAETTEDTIYQIDRDVEDLIIPELESAAEVLGGIVLIAEGIGEEQVTVFPSSMAAEDAAIRILMDPIDGTRGIMYDKRSAFFLAGAAPNKGTETSLQDIETAVMVECPTSRAYLCDIIWAIRGQGAHRMTRHLFTGEEYPNDFSPSKSKTIVGGYGQISRFFPPGKDILAQMEEEMIREILPVPPVGKAVLFNDQYISSGGQLYEMLTGHDRFVADLRATLYRKFKREGKWVGLTCHPYDVSAHLIGAEAGLIITDAAGNPLNSPMTTIGDIDWIAYANPSIQSEVEPVLLRLIEKYIV